MPAIKPTKPQKEEQAEAREVLYPNLSVNQVEVDLDRTIISREQMEELLGWTVVEDAKEDDDTIVLTDEMGQKIRLANNHGNRIFHENVARGYMQDVLNGHWQLNGEPTIVSEYGDVLSGQHTGVGFILACQRWAGWVDGKQDPDTAEHYKVQWPEEPTFKRLVVFGVKATPEIIRTIDNTRPRSEADVIYTSGMFDSLPPKLREMASKHMAFSVRLLWHRTAADQEAYSPIRTRSEVMDFITRHPKLKDCISFIMREEGSKKLISFWLPPGTAAGLMYLMACSNSNDEKYREAEVKNEETLTFGRMAKAKEFWSMLAKYADKDAKSQDANAKTIANARRPVEGEAKPESGSFSRTGFIFSDGGVGGSINERIGTLVKAWKEFIEGSKITPGSIKLEYTGVEWTSDNFLMNFRQSEFPSIGGIDLDHEKLEREAEEKAEAEAEAHRVEKERIDAENLAAKLKEEEEKAKAKAKGGKGKSQPDAGTEKLEGSIRAQLQEMYDANPGAFILLKGSTAYTAYEDQAIQMAKICGLQKKKHLEGLTKCQFLLEQLDKYVPKLQAEGLNVVVAFEGEKGYEFTPLAKRSAKEEPEAPAEEPVKEKKPATKPTPKPAPKTKGPKLRGGTGN